MSRKRPIVLLVRRVVDDKPVWLLHSEHASTDMAEEHWRLTVKGRGITAWSWWGPRRIGQKMLDDPAYHPDSDAIPVGAESERKAGGA